MHAERMHCPPCVTRQLIASLLGRSMGGALLESSSRPEGPPSPTSVRSRFSPLFRLSGPVGCPEPHEPPPPDALYPQENIRQLGGVCAGAGVRGGAVRLKTTSLQATNDERCPRGHVGCCRGGSCYEDAPERGGADLKVRRRKVGASETGGCTGEHKADFLLLAYGRWRSIQRRAFVLVPASSCDRPAN
jgi:hypothetical protein